MLTSTGLTRFDELAKLLLGFGSISSFVFTAAESIRDPV